MKIVKKVLIVLGVIIVGFIAFLFFQPDTATSERSIVMAAPARVIFKQVNELKNWEQWSYWKAQDPTMVNEYSEQPAGVGAWYSWTSENSGEGKLTITEAVPNKSIKTAISFGDMGQGEGYWTFEEVPEGVKVTWGFTSDADGNLIGRFFNLMLDGMMEPAFLNGLGKIKEIAEASPAYSIEIVEEEAEAGFVMGYHVSAGDSDANVSALMADAFGKLMGHITSNKIEQTSMPGTFYQSMQPLKMECVIGVEEGTQGTDTFPVHPTYAGPVVKGIHKGDYNKLGESHEQLNLYIGDKGYSMAGSPWELYVTDPGLVADTAEWITEIYYPIGK